ncbi:MAG: NAD-dependent epimerase/dehydratase family protein [Aquihabitans sp.]
MDPRQIDVAVTGPTGTFGFALVPLLEANPRVRKVVGIARRPFDPQEHGWTKMRYEQGDVRDADSLRRAIEGCDVVVHLAFLVSGASSPETMRAINVEGTVNAYRAAADAGAERFVYASSVAAYGFHDDNPVPLTEDWPVRPDARFAYAAEKAELEGRLAEEAAAHPGPQVFLLRPPIVLGPHAVGAKVALPRIVEAAAGVGWRAFERLPVRIPLAIPATPVQFVHEDDFADALARCVIGAGPPGAYNVAAPDVLTAVDVARELGIAPLPIPAAPVEHAARALAGVPRPSFVPPMAGWVAALARPSIVDCSKAEEQLGWHPQHSSLDALRETLGRPTGA